MNALKLNLFDTVILAQAPSVADAFPAGMVRRPAAKTSPPPASLWRQSLAAMDNASTGRAHRATQIVFAVLGTLTAGSVVIAAGTLIRCLGFARRPARGGPDPDEPLIATLQPPVCRATVPVAAGWRAGPGFPHPPSLCTSSPRSATCPATGRYALQPGG